MIVALEGLEGVGKTTLGKKVAERMGGIYLKSPPEEMNESRGFIAKMPDPRCAFYFYLSSLYAIQPPIQVALASGTPVIVDRYLLSTIAYHDQGRSFDPPPFDASGLFQAALTVNVRCAPELREARLGGRGFNIFERSASDADALAAFFSRECSQEFWNNDGVDVEVGRLVESISCWLG